MTDEGKLREFLQGKKVIYISTKNDDYIRTMQEIQMLQEICTKCEVISYKDKSYAARFLKCFIKTLFVNMKQYDFVYIGFMAQMIVPFLWWKWKKQIVITDFFISIYDTLVDDRKKVRNTSWIGRLVKKIDEITIVKSDYIVADTITHKEYFVNELGAKEKKSFVIYLCADGEIYHPGEIKKPRKYKCKFLVLYFGSILPLQGVEYVLETIKLLEKQDNIHFLIIGPIGDKYEKIEQNNVTYINWLSQKELAECIGYADLCLGGHFNPDIGKAKRTIPGKVYIYESMNKNMILGNSPANHELFEEDRRHRYVELGDSKGLADCIIEMYNESEFYGKCKS